MPPRTAAHVALQGVFSLLLIAVLATAAFAALASDQLLPRSLFDQRPAVQLAGGDGVASVAVGLVVPGIDRHGRAGGDGDAHHSADLPGLRLSSQLSLLALRGGGDVQRSILRREYQLLSALYAQAEQQLIVAEQLRGVDRALTALKVGAATPLAPPALAPRPATPPGERLPPLSLPSPVVTSEGREGWLTGALLLVLIAGLVGFLGGRSGRRHRPVPLPAPAVPALVASDDGGWELQTSESADATLLDSGDRSLGDGGATQADEGAGQGVTGGPGDDRAAAAVLELAEIMLSFGRLRGAEQALEDFVCARPHAALMPWLKLFEVYRQNGRQEAFEALRSRLRCHFNVAPPEWEEASAVPVERLASTDRRQASIGQLLPRLPALAPLPRITQEISRTWGSPECLIYVNRLLRDHRSGQRRGFSMGVVHELLCLIDVMESRPSRVP